ncbi:hypothetical protein AB4Y64_09155 [Lysobacter sp. TAF61]|uniref:hypothetical protein n=1 Tax=Lysobacter sp. TAF61 TaxID=3233072 RepID=UPI003F946F23
MRFLVILPVAVLLASVSSFVVQLIVPHYLDPAQYSQFSLSWSLGQLIVASAYEWLRVSMLRYAGGNAQLASIRVGTLRAMYLIVGAALLALGGALLVGHALCGWQLWVAAACVYACCQGLFDGSQAYLRAVGKNGKLASLMVLRALAGLVFVWISAKLFGAGVAVVFALALSFPIALGGAVRRWRDWSVDGIDPVQLSFLFRFGSLAALSSIASAALQFVARATISSDAVAETAGALFAFDLSLRVLLVLGAAANIVILQRTIASADSGRGEAAYADQMFLAAAVILPAGVGLMSVVGDFTSAIVPVAYERGFESSISLSVAFATLLAFRTFGVDSLFVISGDSRLGLLSPVLALLLVGLGASFLRGSPTRILLLLIIALVVSLAVACIVARRSLVFRMPVRAILMVLVACVPIYAVSAGLPMSQGLDRAVVVTGLGASMYVGMMYLFNIGCCRDLIRRTA